MELVVNNFVRRVDSRPVSDGVWPVGCTIGVLWFSAPIGQVMLMTSRSNDFELYRPARRAALRPQRLLERTSNIANDSSVLTVAPEFPGRD